MMPVTHDSRDVMTSQHQPIVPTVGMGATVVLWTDRWAGTIIEVGENEIVWQRDTANRLDHNGASALQDYRYETNPLGERMVFRPVVRGKRLGQWRTHGRANGFALRLNCRDEFYDFSFDQNEQEARL